MRSFSFGSSCFVTLKVKGSRAFSPLRGDDVTPAKHHSLLYITQRANIKRLILRLCHRTTTPPHTQRNIPTLMVHIWPSLRLHPGWCFAPCDDIIRKEAVLQTHWELFVSLKRYVSSAGGNDSVSLASAALNFPSTLSVANHANVGSCRGAPRLYHPDM